MGAVSCILQRDEGRSPARHHLAWSEAESRFRELPLLRHVEPLLSDLLELVRMCPTFDELGRRGAKLYGATDVAGRESVTRASARTHALSREVYTSP